MKLTKLLGELMSQRENLYNTIIGKESKLTELENNGNEWSNREYIRLFVDLQGDRGYLMALDSMLTFIHKEDN